MHRAPRGLSIVMMGALALSAPACDRPQLSLPDPMRRLTDVRLISDSVVLRALVPPSATLASLLRRHDLIAEEVGALVHALAGKLDPRKLKAGQPYQLDRSADGRVQTFTYDVDSGRRLVARRVAGDQPRFSAEVAPIPRTMTTVVVQGEISRATPSLTEALDAAGERIELALALAEVFSGELDFNSDLQPGDTFRLVVERATRDDGAFAGYGPVLAAEYVNAGRRLDAVRFTPPDGAAGYYDASGRSLQRFFLKSPLKFEPRISSRFSSARRHPVLNYTRAHNGVDYRAPVGTPVGAVAAGQVTFAGWTSGGGHTVRIRHASGYESEYLHLSKILTTRGDRVAQGDVVGRVGATGLTTGPHLHYGLRRNGVYVNPVREHQNLPPGPPIPTALLASFEQHRAGLFRLITATAPRHTN